MKIVNQFACAHLLNRNKYTEQLNHHIAKHVDGTCIQISLIYTDVKLNEFTFISTMWKQIKKKAHIQTTYTL